MNLSLSLSLSLYIYICLCHYAYVIHAYIHTNIYYIYNLYIYKVKSSRVLFSSTTPVYEVSAREISY